MYQSVSDRIQQRMAELDLSQADLMRSTGAARGTVSGWVNGSNNPSAKHIEALSKALKTTSHWLLTGEISGSFHTDQILETVVANDEIRDHFVWIEVVEANFSCGEGESIEFHFDAINGKIVAPVDTTTVVASGGFTGNLSGDVTGGVTGNVVGNTTGTHYGNVIGALDGDVTGSVFADDSSAIVDSIANKITTDSITTQEITVPTISSIDGIVNLEYTDVSILTMKRKQSGAHVNDDSVSRIRFATEDSDTQVIKTQGTITATDNNLLYIPSHDGVLQYANYFKVHKTGKVAINMGQTEIHNEPGATLEVNGNVKIAGANEMLLGNMTTTQRNALTAANGMMIYNTSDNKFQGYENGAWVNLI